MKSMFKSLLFSPINKILFQQVVNIKIINEKFYIFKSFKSGILHLPHILIWSSRTEYSTVTYA